jgi:membrane protease YdiL (CAAX protease family)
MQTYLKSRPAWVQILLFLGVACASGILTLGFGGMLLAALTGIPLNEMGTPVAGRDPGMVLWNIRGMVFLQFIGLFVLPALFFAKLSDPRPERYLGLRAPWRLSYWAMGSAILLISLPLVEYTGLLNHQIRFSASLSEKIRFWEESAMRTLLVMLKDRSISNLLINLVFIALFAGVGEELFFRGILQRLLIRATRSPWAGILLTAACFSFFHFQFYGFIPRFILGALLGAAYWYSGSIWVAIVAHTVFDGMQLIAAWFHPEMAASDTVLNTSAAKLLPAALASGALTVLLLWIMKRNSRSRFAEVYEGELGQQATTNELPL